MERSPEYERAREQIFKLLFPYVKVKEQGQCDLVAQILALPEILIKKDEQESPVYPLARKEQIDGKPTGVVWEVAHSCGWRDGYIEGRADMLRANYVQVVEK